jgi:ABC-type polysaccharide/polyol phosphate transport system ATPase subunit
MRNAVEFHDLTKIYRIYSRPRDRLADLLTGRDRSQKVYALRGVSLQIPGGESFGIIGDNGAGKSTLLKILAGVVTPTAGRVRANGKVTALLELGTGFHPDLSGRENVIMSGRLMDFSDREIRDRMEEIFAFSELGDFIEAPVRTYSSGMFLRLAFSVATGFDPEILIVDEALAVGDDYFQKKCIERIMRFRDRGKTLVFCSHNLYQVRELCERALWLDRGEARLRGPAVEVTDRYLEYLGKRKAVRHETALAAGETEEKLARIRSIRLVDEHGAETADFRTGETLRLEVVFDCASQAPFLPSLGVVLLRSDDVACGVVLSHKGGVKPAQLGMGSYGYALTFPEVPLLSGEYYFNVFLLDDRGVHAFDRQERVKPFRIRSGTEELGLFRLRHLWEKVGGKGSDKKC